MAKSKVTSVSKAKTIKEAGEFWDDHDFTGYDAGGPDIEFNIACTVAIEPDLLAEVEAQARQRGVSVETLVNLWLKEKLIESH